jgi:hypothetical protein
MNGFGSDGAYAQTLTERTYTLAGRLQAGVSRFLVLLDGVAATATAPADADDAVSRGLERHGIARCLERRRLCWFGGRSLAGSADKTKRIKRTGTVVAYAVLCGSVGEQNGPKNVVDETFWQKP